MGFLDKFKGKKDLVEPASEVSPESQTVDSTEQPTPTPAAKTDGKRRFRIEYNRADCSGAALCASLTPHFEMNEDESKANLVEGKQEGDLWVREVELEDGLPAYNLIKSGKICPPQVIKIIDLDSGEQLVP